MTKKILFLGLLLAGFANACFGADYLKKAAWNGLYYGHKGYSIIEPFIIKDDNYTNSLRLREDLLLNGQLLKQGLQSSPRVLSKEGLLACGNGAKAEMFFVPMITSFLLSQGHPVSLEVSKRSQSMLKYSSWYTPEIPDRSNLLDDARQHPSVLIRRIAEPIVFEALKSGLEKASETDMGKSIMQNIPEEYQSAALEHGTFILASAGARAIGVGARQALDKKNHGYITESASDAVKSFKQDTFVYVGGQFAEHCIIKPGIATGVEPALKKYVSPTVEYYTGIKDADWYLKNGLSFAANYFVYTNLNSAAKRF